jgi:hypothetical protein
LGTGCTYQADPTLLELGRGELDITLRNDYQAVLLVGNQLVAQANPDQARVESNRAQLQTAVVTIYDTGGNQLDTYQVAGAGFVDPGTGATPSFGLFGAEILAFDRIQSKVAVPATGTLTVVSRVKILGETLGRVAVETNEFQFPIDLCAGCLVTFPTGSDDPLAPPITMPPTPNCKGALTASGASSGMIIQPCNLGQDQPVDCRLCCSTSSCNAACDPSLRSTAGGG